MLGIGNGLYVQTPNQSKPRILHPAKVVGAKDDVYTVEFDEDDVAVEEGQEVLIYYEVRRDFVKQAARIDAIHADEQKPTVGFTTVGEPVSAESRQHYRVSTAVSDLAATLDGEADCKLMDVSAIGFSVVATERHSVGATIEAELRYEDQRYSGKACVQSVRELDGGRIRHGLHCVDEDKSGASLATGLQLMTMAIQRKQLRRLSRSQ